MHKRPPSVLPNTKRPSQRYIQSKPTHTHHIPLLYLPEPILRSILYLKRSRHTRTGCWWITSSGVEAINLLKTTRSTLLRDELQPRHGTGPNITLPNHCIRRRWGGGILGAGGFPESHGVRVEVEEGRCGGLEEVMARDHEVGGRERGLRLGGQVEGEGDGRKKRQEGWIGAGYACGVVQRCNGPKSYWCCGRVGRAA